MSNAAEIALDNANRLTIAAQFAGAWAAGEFEEVSAKYAHDLGWDAEGETALICEWEGAAAIWNPETRNIEFSDDTGTEWQITERGELQRA